jgi:hypothetical protein
LPPERAPEVTLQPCRIRRIEGKLEFYLTRGDLHVTDSENATMMGNAAQNDAITKRANNSLSSSFLTRCVCHKTVILN